MQDEIFAGRLKNWKSEGKLTAEACPERSRGNRGQII